MSVRHTDPLILIDSMAHDMMNPFRDWATVVDCGDIPNSVFDKYEAVQELGDGLNAMASRTPKSVDKGANVRLITIGGDHTISELTQRAIIRQASATGFVRGCVLLRVLTTRSSALSQSLAPSLGRHGCDSLRCTRRHLEPKAMGRRHQQVRRDHARDTTSFRPRRRTHEERQQHPRWHPRTFV